MILLFAGTFVSVADVRAWEHAEGIEELQSVVPSAMAVDAHRDVFIAAHDFNPNNDSEHLRVIKLRGATGRRVWVAGTAGSGEAGWGGRPSSLAIDRRGDVIVGGRTGSDDVSDALVIKLDGRTGRLQWSAALESQPPSYEGAAVVAGVDRRGDVYASWANHERAVGRLSGQTGYILWKRTDLADFGAMAVGRRTVAVTQYPNRVVALDAGSGADLWTAETSGTSRIQVDRRGAVMFQGFDGGHCTLGKLGARDGTLVWIQDDGTGDTRRAACAPFAVDERSADVAAAIIRKASPIVMRLINGFTGYVAWETSVADLADVGDVAIDRTGDVFAIGSAANLDDLDMLRLARGDGTVMWRRRLSGESLLALHVLADPRGDFIAATVRYKYIDEILMRIVKRDGRTGRDYSRRGSAAKER